MLTTSYFFSCVANLVGRTLLWPPTFTPLRKTTSDMSAFPFHARVHRSESLALAVTLRTAAWRRHHHCQLDSAFRGERQSRIEERQLRALPPRRGNRRRAGHERDTVCNVESARCYRLSI